MARITESQAKQMFGEHIIEYTVTDRNDSLFLKRVKRPAWMYHKYHYENHKNPEKYMEWFIRGNNKYTNAI